MKKIIWIPVVCALLVSLSACNSKSGSAFMDSDSLMVINQQQAAELEGMNAILDEISLMMDSMAVQEGMLFLDGKSEVTNNRMQIKNNVKAFAQLVARQKDKMKEIEERLGKSNASMEKLQKFVSLLKAQIDDKEDEIVMREKQLDDQTLDIDHLRNSLWRADNRIERQRDQIYEQQDIMDAQDKIINECYYLVGTKSQLKDWGILKGGNIFKKSKADMGNVPQEMFHPVDIRDFKTLELKGKNVKLVSPAPNGSYEIIDKGNGNYVFNILDATKFWSVSNYLVVRCD